MLHRRRIPSAAAEALCILIACGCSKSTYEPTVTEERTADPRYGIAILPQHSPALFNDIYQPLVEHLNEGAGGEQFKLIGSSTFGAFERRLAAGEFHFALTNPYQALKAEKSGYRIFGKIADDDQFRGVVLTKRSSPLRRWQDLRGKTISYPAATALASTMLPQYCLHLNGVPLSSVESRYVGSMESAIEAVMSGDSDAAGVWPDPWIKYRRLHPKAAQQLEVRWTTPSLVNNALVVYRSVPNAVAEKLLATLRHLDQTPRGRRLLEHMSIGGFEGATDETYEPVQNFLRHFSDEVRPLPPEILESSRRVPGSSKVIARCG